MTQELSIILKESSALFKERGSTFLSFLLPIKDFEMRLAELRNAHPKAVHFVTASRTLNEFEQIEERCSDDGEPKGTSGMPTLKVLRGYGLVESAIITVRYFGGTLLGSGGLVRAYTQSAKNVILIARLVSYVPTKSIELAVEYSRLSRAEYLAKTLEITLHKAEFLPLFVRCMLTGEDASIRRFLKLYEEF